SVPAAAQWAVYKKPTAEDWAALANLPDFSGVWERGGGAARGGGPAGGAPRAGGAPGGAPRAGGPPGGAPRAGGAARGGGFGAGGGGAGPRGAPGGAVPTAEYAALRDQRRAAG